MITGDNIVIALIILVFATFIVSLGSVAWWTERKPKVCQPLRQVNGSADVDRGDLQLNR